jgi:hypothetical protein
VKVCVCLLLQDITTVSITVVYASPPLTGAKHENASPVARKAQNFRSYLCADEMGASIFIPSRDGCILRSVAS